jgi:hypothetical protein
MSLMVAALSLTLAGCPGGDDGVGSTGGDGHLTVRLTDSPLNIDTVQSVHVMIDSVEVFVADSGDSEGGRIELMPHAETFDLLTLTGGVTELLAAGDLPAGFYKKIRLGVPEADIVFKDQTVADLKLDSRKVDINLPFEIALSESLVVTLDFDAAASLHIVETGSGRYILRPVVTAVIGSDPDPTPLPDPNAPADPNS